MDLWPFGKAVGGCYRLSPAWCLAPGSVVGEAWPAPQEGAFARRWVGLRPPRAFSGLAVCIGRRCPGLRTQSPSHADRLRPAGTSVGPSVAGAWAKRWGGGMGLPIPPYLSVGLTLFPEGRGRVSLWRVLQRERGRRGCRPEGLPHFEAGSNPRADKQ